MAKNNAIHNSFIAGEASRKFAGRTDSAQYNSACEDLKNMIVFPQGGAARRPGTQFVLDLNTYVPSGDTLLGARIFPFTGSDGYRYQIAIIAIEDTNGTTDKYCLIKAINVANHAVTTVYNTVGGTGAVGEAFHDTFWDELADNYATFDQIQIAQSGNVLAFAHPELMPSFLFYTLPSPLASYPQNFYYGQILNDDIAQGMLSSQREKWERIPFTDPLGQTFGTNITVDFDAGTDYDITTAVDYFPAAGGMDGKKVIYKFSDNANTIVLGIDSNSSAQAAAATFFDGVMSVDPTTFGPSNSGSSYEISHWNGLYGYPRTVAFFEGRLVFGGNRKYPDTIWMSQIGDIMNFRTRRLEQDPDFSDPVVATDPFYFALKADIVGTIQWMSPGKTMTVGTNFREFVVFGPNTQQAIGPTNYQSTAETPHGSAYMQAARLENTTVFMQRDRRAVRELVYNLDENSFKAADLNIIAEHMSRKAEPDVDTNFAPTYWKQMVIQQTPLPIIWALDTQGTLSGCTRERGQNVVAWHHHEIAGEGFVSTTAYTPKIECLSVAPVPGDVEYDELWMVVTRGVGASGSGTKKWYVERLGKEWERTRLDTYFPLNTSNAAERLEEVPVYMDCAKIYDEFDNPGATSLSNLPHGNGASVSVVVNGFYLGEYTVSGNAVDISDKIGSIPDPTPGDNSDWIAIVGFNYDAYVVPYSPEVPAQLGTSQGSPRRTHEIIIHFFNSFGCEFGRKTDTTQDNTPIWDMERIIFGDMSYNPPVNGFTGEKSVVFPPSYELRPQLKINSYLPFPMHVTHIVNKMVVYE